MLNNQICMENFILSILFICVLDVVTFALFVLLLNLLKQKYYTSATIGKASLEYKEMRSLFLLECISMRENFHLRLQLQFFHGGKNFQL